MKKYFLFGSLLTITAPVILAASINEANILKRHERVEYNPQSKKLVEVWSGPRDKKTMLEEELNKNSDLVVKLDQGYKDFCNKKADIDQFIQIGRIARGELYNQFIDNIVMNTEPSLAFLPITLEYYKNRPQREYERDFYNDDYDDDKKAWVNRYNDAGSFKKLAEKREVENLCTRYRAIIELRESFRFAFCTKIVNLPAPCTIRVNESKPLPLEQSFPLQ